MVDSQRLILLAGVLLLVSPAVPVLAEGPAPTGDVRPPFVIGIEDQLQVMVWKEPELSMTVTVRPDGKITVPLVGDVVAEGRTPTELSNELTQILSTYVKDPIVTVMVTQINHYKIFVLGEVNAQGELQLTRPTRFLQAIGQAGGLSQYADKSNITILRYENGEEVRIQVDYKKIFNGRDPEANILLRPGDTILVR